MMMKKSLVLLLAALSTVVLAQTRPEAALIIGGYDQSEQGSLVTDVVELVGCENGNCRFKEFYSRLCL